MRNSFYLFLLLLLLSSCKHSYEIDREKIELSYNIDHGFELFQLDVKQYDSDNTPLHYKKTSIGHCVTNNHPSRDRFDIVVSKETALLYRSTWRTQKEIDKEKRERKENPPSKYEIAPATKRKSIRNDIMKMYFPFEPEDVIFFKKPNKNYQWRIGEYSSSDLDIFPVDFKTEVWYKIAFSNKGCHVDDFFFKFDKMDKIKSKHVEGNCMAAW